MYHPGYRIICNDLTKLKRRVGQRDTLCCLRYLRTPHSAPVSQLSITLSASILYS